MALNRFKHFNDEDVEALVCMAAGAMHQWNTYPTETRLFRELMIEAHSRFPYKYDKPPETGNNH